MTRSTIIFIILLIAEERGFARALDVPDVVQGVRVSNGPYCGIRSLYAAMYLYGTSVSLDDLIKREYIGSPQGSTFEQLIQAARDHDFNAAPVQNMAPEDLQNCRCPTILFVKADASHAVYDHFVLFIESRGDQAFILDAPLPVRGISFADLSRIWSGKAIIISKEPISIGSLAAGSLPRYAFYTIVCVFGIGVFHLVQVRWGVTACSYSVLRSSIIQASALMLCATSFALSYHKFSDAGFLASPLATAAVEQTYAPLLLPQVTVAEAKDARANGAVLIDARLEDDFESAHIPGTINIPAGSSDSTRQSKLHNVSLDAPIIVFCKSSSCGYSLEVAKSLLRFGYKNVRMFRGGWDDWVATYGMPTTAPTTSESRSATDSVRS